LCSTESANNAPDAFLLTHSQLEPVLKSIYAIIQLLLPAYTFTRYSLLALYLRIFADPFVRKGTWALIVLVTLQWIAFAMASFFQCTPVSYFWDRFTIQGTCFNIDGFYRAVTIPNIIFDFFIIILPLPLVWQLKASRLRKSGLTFLFGIGLMFVSPIRPIPDCLRLSPPMSNR